MKGPASARNTCPARMIHNQVKVNIQLISIGRKTKRRAITKIIFSLCWYNSAIAYAAHGTLVSVITT